MAAAEYHCGEFGIMWENERKKTIIRNGIILLVLVAAAAALLMAMFTMKKKIDAEDALLQEEHANQRQELNEARQENVEAIRLTYEDHKQVLAQYMPGIVCWGDSLTAGSSGNVSYPLTLQKYINTYLCDIYDLRYSVDNPSSYSRMDWEDYKIAIPVVNMGAGREDSATVLGRAGVVPYAVRRSFEIPAGTESVDISIRSQSGRAVNPLTAGNVGVNPVTIAGVQGTLTLTTNQNSGTATYQFARLEPGAQTEVEKDTPIITACQDQYKDYVHIVWLGTYGEFNTAEQLVQETKTLLQRQTLNSDRYLVIGPCATRGSWQSANATTLDAVDSAMLQAFGSHYINLRKYLIEDGLRDAGISATRQDTESISRGMVPESFRSNAGGADLNGVAYNLLGQLVYERMELLGYFDEIRQELHLDKIAQDLVKEDPAYFDKALKVG